jgi:hypothetical protein
VGGKSLRKRTPDCRSEGETTTARPPCSTVQAASSSGPPIPIWPGRVAAPRWARIERTREIARKASTEIVYLITSLPPETASPQRLLRLARDHWELENRLRYVRAGARHPRVAAGPRPHRDPQDGRASNVAKLPCITRPSARTMLT